LVINFDASRIVGTPAAVAVAYRFGASAARQELLAEAFRFARAAIAFRCSGSRRTFPNSLRGSTFNRRNEAGALSPNR